jgi:GNAT superfamily N-acetyltransferase
MARAADGGRRESLDIRPLSSDRWPDLERLFGRSGAFAGCWCMFWRLSSGEMAANGSAGNREALQALASAGREPGLVAYRRGEPVGWVSVAPREEFGRLQRSPHLKSVDDEKVWSVVCFFVRRDQRGTGVASAMLRGAIDHAAASGARAIEAYPRELGDGRTADTNAYLGTVSMFTGLGFREVARRTPKRPILRLALQRSDVAP